MGITRYTRGSSSKFYLGYLPHISLFAIRVSFADVPLILSLGPITLKLDVNTHLPDYDCDYDDDVDDGIDSKKSNEDKTDLTLITDAFTVADITKTINDIKGSLEFNCNHTKGLLRYI